MAVRKIIQIDQNKCNGCGLCVPSCAEGAIQIIDGKARVVKDSFCDGLGACLGHCPQDALKIIEREADEFDEEAALEHIRKTQGVQAVHEHRAVHGGTCQTAPQLENHQQGGRRPGGRQGGGCPGSRAMALQREKDTGPSAAVSSEDVEVRIRPQLRQWPVQLTLLSLAAAYFEDADLLVSADCVPFAYPNFHLDLLKGKVVGVGCPKLDDIQSYVEKLTDIIKFNNIKSITVAFMEVPCCGGIVRAVDMAVAMSGKDIPVHKIKIGINGDKKSTI